jgi:hypothetical protein
MNTDRLISTSEEQFLKKASRRRELAKLPIEEKLKRLVKLQGVAYTIGRQAGRQTRRPWGTKVRTQS